MPTFHSRESGFRFRLLTLASWEYTPWEAADAAQVAGFWYPRGKPGLSSRLLVWKLMPALDKQTRMEVLTLTLAPLSLSLLLTNKDFKIVALPITLFLSPYCSIFSSCHQKTWFQFLAHSLPAMCLRKLPCFSQLRFLSPLSYRWENDNYIHSLEFHESWRPRTYLVKRNYLDSGCTLIFFKLWPNLEEYIKKKSEQ